MSNSDRAKILVVMGSQSDWPTMKETCNLLTKFSVDIDTRIISAHRTPERIQALAEELSNRTFSAVVAGAGGAAHLAGAIASRTIVPVIGVPIASPLQGFDSLLSTVQMPAGIPVATVSVGVAGARNGALLALQIIAQSDQTVFNQLLAYRRDLAERVPYQPVVPENAL